MPSDGTVHFSHTGKEQTEIKDDRKLVERNVHCSKAVTQLSLSFIPGTNHVDMKKKLR